MDYEVKSIKIQEKQIKSQKETEEDDGLKKISDSNKIHESS